VLFLLKKARRSLALSICGTGLLFLTNFCLAGSMTVFPLRVTFEGSKTSEVVTVRNTDTKPLLLQPSMTKWTQVDGQEVLEPTRDILLSPPLVEIPPGESQTVRIVVRRDADATTQSTYRLVLQEVPRKVESTGQQVVMALKITLPVFVTAKTPSPPILSVATTAGSSVLQFTNSGKSHIQVKTVAVSDGTSQIAKSESMFYVLSGQTIKLKVDPKGRSINGSEKIEVGSDAGDLVLNLTAQ
jgi:fimbrial chaperone protein